MKYMNGLLWILFACLFCCTSCEFKTSETQSDLKTTADSEAKKRTDDLLHNMNKAAQIQRDETHHILNDVNQ